MIRALTIAGLLGVASTNGFAQEYCLYELSPPEAPYYVAGSPVVPQSNYIAVEECGKTVEEVKADIKRAYQKRAQTVVWSAPDGPIATPNTISDAGDVELSITSGGFANCSAARSAGQSRIHRGSAGYASRLDRDGDGIACE